MEQRLIKQRNRLFLRISFIMSAVWLIASAAYCTIRLNSEKSTVQNHESASFATAQHQLSTNSISPDYLNLDLLNSTNLTFFENQFERNNESQYIISRNDSHKAVADTAGKIIVEFGIKTGVESSSKDVGYIDYHTVRNALSDNEYQTIENRLNTTRSDGNFYELICTKFHIHLNQEFVPLEMKIVLINAKDTRFIEEDNVEVFTLSDNFIEGEEINQCSDLWRNTIPSGFLLNGGYNQDVIGTLTDEQREKGVDMIATAPMEYIFYTSDYLYLKDYTFYDDSKLDSNTKLYVTNGTSYIIQYAKKIHLLEECGTELIIGTAIIFAFFLAIAFILCVMIWRTVKFQMIQEQKRIDLTNALAHDIKTPLFIISGYAQNLKANINNESKERYAERIIGKTNEANSLVHKMLNFSKLDSYKMTLNCSEFDLCELAKEILEDYQNLPDGKAIVLTHSGNNFVNADKELVKTAMNNLVDNAVKYSTPNSEIQIEVIDKTFRISNESENLTKADLKQIWQPYVKKDKSRHQNGNGLGLPIVKSILELHEVKYNMKLKDKQVIFTLSF